MNTADVLKTVLTSKTETDSSFNPATVVDGLFAIAKALDRVAEELRGIDQSLSHAKVGEALEGLASLKDRDHE